MMSCMTSASSPSIVVCMAPSLKGSPEASISGIIPATNSPSPSPTPKGATEKLASMMDLQSSRNDSAYGTFAARLYPAQSTTSRSGRPPNPDPEADEERRRDPLHEIRGDTTLTQVTDDHGKHVDGALSMVTPDQTPTEFQMPRSTRDSHDVLMVLPPEAAPCPARLAGELATASVRRNCGREIRL